MPNIDLSILNQRQTPAFYADTLANRPSAGFVGRIFVSTDTFAFYRDNGTTWDLIGGPGTGTVTGTGAAGQVTYWNGASTITGTNNLFYDTANSRLGVNTNAPTASLDIHSASNTIAQFNQTVPTNDTRIVFQNGGSSLWRIGNLYNAGANDFEIFDVIGSLQSLTIKKTTGQVLIGTSTVGGGKLVVSSATADNGVQIVGASAPSLRLDDAVTGATKRAGLGISTAVNNFIQGSADRDFCIFNGSTTASPILFGVYNGTNIQEAARISTSRNLLIGTTTDAGQSLQVNGSTYIASNSSIGTTSGNISGQGANVRLLTIQGVSGDWGGVEVATTKTVAGSLIGFYGFANSGLSATYKLPSYIASFIDAGGVTSGADIRFYTQTNGTGGASERMRITSAGNIGIGTTTPTDYSIYGFGPVIETRGGVGGVFITKNSTGTILGSLSTDSGNSVVKLKAETNHALAFSTNDLERGRFSSGGNFLIGTTTSGSSKLRIVGLPTSAAGLSSGDVYSNLGVLTIVP